MRRRAVVGQLAGFATARRQRRHKLTCPFAQRMPRSRHYFFIRRTGSNCRNNVPRRETLQRWMTKPFKWGLLSGNSHPASSGEGSPCEHKVFYTLQKPDQTGKAPFPPLSVTDSLRPFPVRKKSKQQKMRKCVVKSYSCESTDTGNPLE